MSHLTLAAVAVAVTESQLIDPADAVVAVAAESRAVKRATAAMRVVRDTGASRSMRMERCDGWYACALLRNVLSALAWGGATGPAVPVITILLPR